MFKGIYTAIITPFLGGKLDLVSFEALVKEQKESGISGIAIAGTTGEAPTLSRDEKVKLLEVASKYRDESFKLILGTGSNNTQHVIEETKYFQNLGIDGVLIVTPYYNKPTQDGLFLHYKAIHDNTNTSIVLYNVPGRTAVSMTLETIIKLSKLERITSIKEASGNLFFASEIKNAVSGVDILSGDDGTFLPFLSIGGDGCISVVSNVAPKLMVELYTAYKENRNEDAIKINRDIIELTKALFLETNPIPVKTALVEMNKVSEEFRLPLSSMGEMNRRMLRMTLRRVGLF